MRATYDAVVNRESAYEIVSRQAVPAVATSTPAVSSPAGEPEKKRGALGEFLWGTKRRQGMVETMAKQAARTGGQPSGSPDPARSARGILGGEAARLASDQAAARPASDRAAAQFVTSASDGPPDPRFSGK